MRSLVLVVHNARLPPDVHRVVRGEQHVILPFPFSSLFFSSFFVASCGFASIPLVLSILRSRREARRAQAELPSPYRGPRSSPATMRAAGFFSPSSRGVRWNGSRSARRAPDPRRCPASTPRESGVVMMMEVLDLQADAPPSRGRAASQAVVRGQRGHYEDGEVPRSAIDPRHGSRPRPPAARL